MGAIAVQWDSSPLDLFLTIFREKLLDPMSLNIYY